MFFMLTMKPSTPISRGHSHERAGQFLNMSQSSFSMGVFPMVLRKKRSSIRSEEINLSEGRSRSNLPNLEENRESPCGLS